MRVEIEFLGPIREADLELGDVTVLLGPPNVGKSYTLKAIHNKLIYFTPTFKHIVVNVVRENLIKVIHNILINIIRDKLENKLLVSKEKPGKFELNESKEIKIEEIMNGIMDILKELENLTLPIGDKTKIKIIDLDEINLTRFVRSLLINSLSEQSLRKNLRERVIRSKPYEMKVKIDFKVEMEKIVTLVTLSITIFSDSDYRSRPKWDTVKDRLEDLFDLYFVREINIISENMEKYFYKILQSFSGRNFNLLTFIPFGRTPLITSEYGKSLPKLYEFFWLIDESLDVPPYYLTYLLSFEEGYEKFRRGRFKEISELFSAILQGELEYDKTLKLLRYHKWGSESITLSMSSALATEVAGIFIPLLALPVGSIILIEEPESQLHPSAQILMAISLYAIAKKFNHKIILSTHSDLFALTLAYLKELKYKREDLIELMKRLLELQGIKIENGEEVIDKFRTILEALEKESKLDVRFYSYEPADNGVKVREVSANEILENVPQITDVVSILLWWASSRVSSDAQA